jgi:hypothetical protein
MLLALVLNRSDEECDGVQYANFGWVVPQPSARVRGVDAYS